MAAIDKTYLNSYKEYQELIRWCEGKSFTLSNGDVIYPSKFIYDYWIEEDFIKDGKPCFRPVWNTPMYLDIWVIRNCPLPFMQRVYKDMFEEDYDKIKEGTSNYDTFKRNGVGKNLHYKIISKYRLPFKSNDLVWDFSISGYEWDYNYKHKTWYHAYEALPWNSNRCTIKGNVSKKKLYRIIRRWNLPKGVTINATCMYGRYIIKTLQITIK